MPMWTMAKYIHPVMEPLSARDQSLAKGKGLGLLLHGTPGSGKTLTAETAAMGARRALVMTSVGELNERETSNAVNTARTITWFEKRLQWEHIRTVLEVRSTFDVKVQSMVVQ
ncbi:uncharacterized protein PG986_000759 [Apiospora aurea]|uniref:ATPase AAA-type core domain-containing protein n=1 Tax=Apiospora aurea TaxID=335848 RepID=A0ABR1QVG1_9PEZI